MNSFSGAPRRVTVLGRFGDINDDGSATMPDGGLFGNLTFDQVVRDASQINTLYNQVSGSPTGATVPTRTTAAAATTKSNIPLIIGGLVVLGLAIYFGNKRR